MLEKSKEVPQLADATYVHTLVVESTHEYRLTYIHLEQDSFPIHLIIMLKATKYYLISNERKFVSLLVYTNCAAYNYVKA